MTRARQGFVLAELLVAMLIAAIIGVSLTQLRRGRRGGCNTCVLNSSRATSRVRARR